VDENVLEYCDINKFRSRSLGEKEQDFLMALQSFYDTGAASPARRPPRAAPATAPHARPTARCHARRPGAPARRTARSAQLALASFSCISTLLLTHSCFLFPTTRQA
jgi:hypothetical protein